MLGAVRQGQVLGRVLRTCSVRSISYQIPRRPARWQQLSAKTSPFAVRTLHSSIPLSRPSEAAAAQAAEQEQSAEHEKPITHFKELGDRGLVSDKIISNITDKMGLTTMTDVQSMTINATLNGADT